MAAKLIRTDRSGVRPRPRQATRPVENRAPVERLEQCERVAAGSNVLLRSGAGARPFPVAARLVVEVLAMAQQRGLSKAELLADDPLGSADLRAGSFVPWDDYARLLDLLEVRLGGPWEIEQMVYELTPRSAMMQLVAGLALGPRHLYYLGAHWFAPRVYPHLGFRLDDEPSGRLRLAYAIPPACRGSSAYGYCSQGLFRAYPRLLGLPPAVVEADIGPHFASFLISPPPSGTLVARARRALDRIAHRFRGGEEELAGAAAAVFDASTAAAEGRLLGQRLIRHVELAAMIAELELLLRERFLCESISLWVQVPATGALRRVHAGCPPRATGSCVRSLELEGQPVGRIELDVPGLGADIASPVFDALMPWLALALKSCTSGVSDRASRMGERVAAFSSEIGLTPRETQVLALLAHGRANKEIAASLCCAVRTVEVHVARVLRRANVTSRSALVTRLWEGPPS